MKLNSDSNLGSKSSVDEIRARFDADVERFSNLETGQSATIDAPLVLDIVAEVAEVLGRDATGLLDIGCGAGNWTLKLLPRLPKLENVSLIDLSLPMLERARKRIDAAKTSLRVELCQDDIRRVELGVETFDVAVAAAVLHHLREEQEWVEVFTKIYTWLKPGGCFFVADLTDSGIPAVAEVMNARYSVYLERLGGAAMVEKVFAYIEKEDTQRPLVWQLETLRQVGFRQMDVLHKNGPFGAYVAIK